MLLSRFAQMFQPFLAPDDLGAGGNPPAPAAPPAADLPAPAPAASPAPPTEFLDFGGRRVPVADPALRDLHGDWQNQQRELTRLSQENQRFQAALQALGTGQAPGQPAQPQGPTPEEAEAFMAEFYENPLSALQKWGQQFVGQTVMSRVEPFLQQQEFVQQLTQLATAHDDLPQVTPIMDKLLDLAPELAEGEGAMERVYSVAKAMAGQATNGSPEQILNDPAFQARVLSHEGIRNQIISAYLAGKQSQTAGLPPAPSAMAAGVAPAAPPNAPTSLRQGTKSFLARMGMRS